MNSSKTGSRASVDLIHGPIMPSLLTFMFPVFISNVFQQLYNAADTAIVGNFLGENSLAAIGACASIFELLTVFMLAFMSPLGAAMNNTGAGQIIADKVIALTGHSGTFIIMAAMWLLTWALTQVMSNTAACTLLCPISWTIAETIGADPRAVVIAVFIASSVAVCTPMAIPANAMILGPGNVRFKDFVVPGLAVSVVCFIVSMILLPIFYPFYPG